MQTESTVEPRAITIERCGELAEVIFCEHIQPIDRDGTAFYIYDEYRITVPYRENLMENVEKFRDAWIQKAKEAEPQIDYDGAVAALIRQRYTLDAELAILRQQTEKPEEYQAYFTYCEQCKTEVKAKIGGAKM